jgi:hypothetical protein
MDERNFGEELSNAEVYEMADTLLRRHGKDAAMVASMQAGEKLKDGDMEGYRTWKRLVMLVDGMMEGDVPKRECLH